MSEANRTILRLKLDQKATQRAGQSRYKRKNKNEEPIVTTKTSGIQPKTSQRTKPNQPCPCGKLKPNNETIKWKHCCGSPSFTSLSTAQNGERPSGFLPSDPELCSLITQPNGCSREEIVEYLQKKTPDEQEKVMKEIVELQKKLAVEKPTIKKMNE
jgi:hypothetical protein